MNTLSELIAQRTSKNKEVAALDRQIKEMTDLPSGWTIDPGNGRMAGGVTLYGKMMDADGRWYPMVICAYDDLILVEDPESSGRIEVDADAVKAALRILEIKRAEK